MLMRLFRGMRLVGELASETLPDEVRVPAGLARIPPTARSLADLPDADFQDVYTIHLRNPFSGDYRLTAKAERRTARPNVAYESASRRITKLLKRRST